MNKSRELFLLFPYVEQKVEGYTCIYKHTFPNDEPPYIVVSYWGVSSDYTFQKASKIEADENWKLEEQYNFYLIRNKDAQRFIHLMNNSQTDYCDFYLEGVYTRNAGEHNLSAKKYAEGGYIRPPKVKYMGVQPIV